MTVAGFFVVVGIFILWCVVSYTTSDDYSRKKRIQKDWDRRNAEGRVQSHNRDGSPRDPDVVMKEHNEAMFKAYEKKYGKDPRWHD